MHLGIPQVTKVTTSLEAKPQITPIHMDEFLLIPTQHTYDLDTLGYTIHPLNLQCVLPFTLEITIVLLHMLNIEQV